MHPVEIMLVEHANHKIHILQFTKRNQVLVGTAGAGGFGPEARAKQ